MSSPRTIQQVVEDVAGSKGSERELAIALHDHVRERVKFGFNKYFDATPPEYLLACGYGHCNPKSRLMVALFRAAGLEAHQHFVVIPKDILKDAIPASRFWMIPAQVSHSYVEVKVDGGWCEIDSHIVDTLLLQGGQVRLRQEGRSLGYGVRMDSVNVWDGQGNAFSQFDRSMMIEDHGRVDDLDAYFRSKAYRGRVLGMSFNTMFQLMGEFGVAPMNVYLDKVRH